MNGEPVNSILASLPTSERTIIQAQLTAGPLRHGAILLEPGQAVERICFPSAGVISVIAALENDDSVETMTVGPEGVLGASAAFFPVTAYGRALVQIPGAAHWLPADWLRGRLEDLPRLRELLVRRLELTVSEAQQTAACNAVHTLPQRLAKWLLRCHDRAGGDVLTLTQEFLSHMLGAHRTTVTQVASSLQGRGLIRYQRGRVEIVDRPGLEALTCECYAAVTSRQRELA